MENLEKKIKDKKRKPFFKRLFNKKNLKKPDRVAVIYLRKTGVAQPMEVESKKGFFSVEEKTYHIDRDCRFTLTIDNERLPLFIQEEDGLTPKPTHQFYEGFKVLDDFGNRVAETQNMAIKAIRHAELVRATDRDGSKINPKVAIGLVIIAIIAFAIFRSYSG